MNKTLNDYNFKSQFFRETLEDLKDAMNPDKELSNDMIVILDAMEYTESRYSYSL